MTTTQDGRLLSIATPLGKDFLLLNRLTANEGLSELFSIEAELLHEEIEAGFAPTVIDPRRLLGQGVTIQVQSSDGAARAFSGIVNKFSQGNRNVRFSFYYISIVPHVWLLTQKSQSRIFQQKSVPDILREVLGGFRFKNELQRTYDPRNYCVQYRETDWDFASRLMEEEGIFYFFEHKEGTHQLIIADTPQSHAECPGKSAIPFFINVGDEARFVSSVSSFVSDTRIKTGKVTLWDYNFELPTNQLNLEQPSRYAFGDSQKLEHYDFPGGYARKYDGVTKEGGEQSGELQKIFSDRERTVKNLMESLDAGVTTAAARSDCCSITAGYRLTLENHPNGELNKSYVVTAATHEAEQSPSYVSNEAPTDPYTNSFNCMKYGDGAVPFRPLRRTPKPILHGAQTAIVVGPAGEEIFTDKYGRIKVQFHWDRDGQVDASSSCWVRVGQMWAGNRWGAMFIPRIGMEVIVNFLEGDPDQPIVTGCVYNPQTMPPYTLPNEKTKSGIKTNSSKGGQGFNELRFEDKKGSEQIFVHAEKDQDVRVKHDHKELIVHDRHLIVDNEQFEKVKKDKHLKVLGDRNEKVDGSISVDAGMDIDTKAGTKFAVDSGTEIHLKSGTNLTIETGTNLTLKVGGNFININSGGIFIKGTMVMINSGGAAGAGAGANPDPPKEPKEPVTADPGQATVSPPRQAPPPRPEFMSPAAQVLLAAAENASTFCEICRRS